MLYKNQDAPVLSLFSLKGKVSLITGGSRGIGLAAAIGLAEAGSDVAITYNSSSPSYVKELESQFKNLGVMFKTYRCNVAIKADNDKCVAQVLNDFGRLDVVVPNAGICIHVPAEENTEEQYREVMGVNLDGAYFTAQAAANAFKKQKEQGILEQGRIVFTASVSSGVVNYPQKQAVYNASKAGLVRLAKCLAVEWVDFARVNCVSPGFIDTEMLDVHPKEWRKTWFNMIPAKRLCAPYELKGVYVFIASDASSYMTGEEVFVGGGYTLI
ncbi:NAD(P)-dependent, short-chain alcohol dehydrogenase [Yamadazyma tenuis]|uniref:NAD(P)-binding protein n=1 Tax=Candida tenuis (strain ATCC 10573 / BCRC 21748 / CBS 615 / JCM 9827 / NBRC 10315 / NRRL Y-1498 / VKM Y-70) TaxID=590646 RepID=G3B0Q9_CANTC|nr:NAD(P)-binding protein [Yamadazyma tenuis ATCC 10573]EGV65452.1 NAD(P)-binding protein [Yamadazyma tenuis ATCC 10573]WEJ94868.1 NAD(P)-dependent, short-chain alcohol dehydrogenase [Yamadazyma tenuis]